MSHYIMIHNSFEAELELTGKINVTVQFALEQLGARGANPCTVENFPITFDPPTT